MHLRLGRVYIPDALPEELCVRNRVSLAVYLVLYLLEHLLSLDVCANAALHQALPKELCLRNRVSLSVFLVCIYIYVSSTIISVLEAARAPSTLISAPEAASAPGISA